MFTISLNFIECYLDYKLPQNYSTHLFFRKIVYNIKEMEVCSKRRQENALLKIKELFVPA
jgi:hypothetical protein